MGLTWVDAAQSGVAGLVAVLGVHATEEALRALRRRGLCPDLWNRDRAFLASPPARTVHNTFPEN